MTSASTIGASGHDQSSDLAVAIRSAIGHAVLAPSSHNTQPWLFRILENGLELRADRRRALPVVDPHDRELVISCGAALWQLVIALRHDGLDPKVDLLPDGEQSDLLARVLVSRSHHPTEDEENLFAAISKRHTNRYPFEPRRIETTVLSDLINDAQCESCWIHMTHASGEKQAIAELISQGDGIQMSDRPFRRELAAWIHSNRSKSRDGMPGYAHGIGDLASNFGSLVVRTFDLGKGQAAKDRQLAEGSPLLVILGTKADTQRDWICCGQALARILLRAASARVDASFMNQPIEVEQLRTQLADLIGGDGFPQILLRMGYGRAVPSTPRRPVEDLILN